MFGQLFKWNGTKQWKAMYDFAEFMQVNGNMMEGISH